jgi:CspA family cold shock protein
MELGRGKIIFFNKKSRFGFIKNYYDNKNYYVHEKNLLSMVEQEDEVEFLLKEAKRGLEAIQVKKIS